jgi:excisionase family DNA binding protein
MNMVAERLNCSKSHVSKLINGKVKGVPALPYVKLGRRRGVIETTLNRYLKQREGKQE